MPAGLRDSAEDVLEPLFAIADQAGGEWPEQARTAAVVLMGSVSDQDINVELLHDIFAIFAATAGTFIKSSDLAAKLAELDDRPWGDWKHGKPITARAVADWLKGFGIAPRPNGPGTSRGYDRDRFEDAWTRYPTIKPSDRQTPNENGPEVAFSNRQTSDASDTLKMQVSPINTGLSDGLTVCNRGNGADTTPDGFGDLFRARDAAWAQSDALFAKGWKQ